jgi:hypothetical protein
MPAVLAVSSSPCSTRHQYPNHDSKTDDSKAMYFRYGIPPESFRLDERRGGQACVGFAGENGQRLTGVVLPQSLIILMTDIEHNSTQTKKKSIIEHIQPLDTRASTF